MKTKYNFTREQVAEAYRKGITDRAAGRILGCSCQTASHFRARYRIPRQNLKITRPIYSGLTEELQRGFEAVEAERGEGEAATTRYLIGLGLKVLEKRKQRQGVGA